MADWTDASEPEGPGGVRSQGAGSAERETAEQLARLRGGDPEAFEELARRHAPRLFRLALSLTGRREDAEDLVQETLVRTLPALRRFEGRASLSTYLLRSLGNVWKNQLRSRRRSKIVDWFRKREHDRDASGAGPEPIDPRDSPLERIESREVAARVRRAVARLEPHRRWTLLLREVEDLSYEQIAGITGVAVGTVRSRLARAREELRQWLGDLP